MSKVDNNHSLREQLLSHEKYSPELYEQYRKELGKMLERHEHTRRREKWVTLPVFIYIVLLCTAFLVIAGFTENATMKLWFGILACFWLIVATMQVVRYHIIQLRLDLLREVKDVQLRVLELLEKVEKKS